MKAISKGDNIEIIRDIVFRNPSSLIQINGCLTPLMNAAKYGYAAAVQLLISHGCPVNDIDKTGKTALSIAVNHGHLDVVKSLLIAGAKVNNKDSKGMTPLMICCK